MTLVQFPADRRTADIRRCAEALHSIHGHEANLFWRSEMLHFAEAMRSQGVAEEEISRQAGLFMHAVQIELQMMFAGQDAGASAL